MSQGSSDCWVHVLALGEIARYVTAITKPDDVFKEQRAPGIWTTPLEFDFMGCTMCRHANTSSDLLPQHPYRINFPAINPREQIRILFGTIAGSTRWDYIPGFVSATNRHCYNVVESLSGATAVRTATLVFLPPEITNNSRHPRHRSFISPGAASSSPLPLSMFLQLVWTIKNCLPGPNTDLSPASRAFGTVARRPGPIFRELCGRYPRFTTTTPFKPGFDFALIFL